MGNYTTIDQVKKCCKMLKNNNQKHDFLNQLCQFVSLLCCIKLSIIVQRSYINVLTKRLRKQSTGTYITTSQTSKNRVFWELFFSVDRSLYTFPCFVFLVILVKCPCNVIIHSCQILCNTTKNWQNWKFAWLCILFYVPGLGWILDPDLVVSKCEVWNVNSLLQVLQVESLWPILAS